MFEGFFRKKTTTPSKNVVKRMFGSSRIPGRLVEGSKTIAPFRRGERGRAGSMEPIGIEPTTSSMRPRRSPN